MVERKERASLDKDIFFLGWNEDFPSGRVLTCTLSLPSLLAPPRHLYLLHSLSSLAARVCSRLFLLRSLSALAVSTYFFTPGGVIPRSPSGRVCGGVRSSLLFSFTCFFSSGPSLLSLEGQQAALDMVRAGSSWTETSRAMGRWFLSDSLASQLCMAPGGEIPGGVLPSFPTA